MPFKKFTGTDRRSCPQVVITMWHPVADGSAYQRAVKSLFRVIAHNNSAVLMADRSGKATIWLYTSFLIQVSLA